MTRQDKFLLAVSVAIATTVTLSGIHAKNTAELSGVEAGMYRQMPGIVQGLLTGFSLDSRMAVVGVTIATNAVLYFLILRFALQILRKTN